MKDYQIRFYKDIDNENEYIVVHNENLLNEFKKERELTGKPPQSCFPKENILNQFGNQISMDNVKENSYLIIYEFVFYSGDDASIYEKKFRIV
jgi:hypothetical protein